mmetsp:Transcript_9837/g.14753  ORF Transcript_9837/g.14753 Transcript_9837/m.14753 type:complete len:255 (-) Transcript_9837:287-1051(-)|eukprot:CAMPEP_0116011716 /NCGR_PEP_ID=MMETSP0321-20121206/4719_1 /TAXON_ID=163516 /ORGANISM="Leptocylindrus danicus var. danicus, Strain B650" /LENGTH=254 /DNA_ID=CAMNT_0003480973 /DNA_START=115 /DNA_END=879 /DNA_ORIENTATION=-
MNSITDLVSSAAITTTVAGNIGVDPFLTMFLVGLIEQLSSDSKHIIPDDLKSFVSNYEALAFWGIMSILEVVAKCVPVIDEIVDSVEVFIVPVLSILGTFSTFGLYDIDESSSSSKNSRGLEEDEGDNDSSSGSGIAQSAVRVVQIMMVAIGVGLALSIHLFKMLVRVLGEGWLTQILTVCEVIFCVTSISIAMFVQGFAIFMACVFIAVSVHSGRKKWKEYQEKQKEKADKNLTSGRGSKKTQLLPTLVPSRG